MKYFPSIQQQQFLTLLLLFILGKCFSNIYPSWFLTITLLGWAVLIEHGLIYYKNGKLEYFSISPLSTTLGVLLMMSSPHGWLYFAVVLLALAQKNLLTVSGNHFFNPSNFALIAAMLLFYSQAHVVLGQLGDDLWLRTVTSVVALAILIRVDRWIIPVAFLIAYFVLEYLLVVSYDPVMTFEMIYERLYAVSFIVFIAFMLTDPRTTPSKMWQQLVFAIVISFVASYLDRLHGFRVQHIFMALFVSSVWIPALNTAGSNKKKVIITSAILFVLALGVIIFIENQPPYYFDMEG